MTDQHVDRRDLLKKAGLIGGTSALAALSLFPQVSFASDQHATEKFLQDLQQGLNHILDGCKKRLSALDVTSNITFEEFQEVIKDELQFLERLIALIICEVEQLPEKQSFSPDQIEEIIKVLFAFLQAFFHLIVAEQPPRSGHTKPHA